MAYKKVKAQGGNGKGHSAMTHWTYTEEIKKSAKKFRRAEGKKECQKF